MDFFEGQMRARRRTGLLVLFFALAVALIVVSVFLVVAVVFWLKTPALTREPFLSWIWTQPELMAAALGGTLLVVAAGTGIKLLLLRSGGEAVALSLGGRLVMQSTTDPDERKLLNIVEEMAIAVEVDMGAGGPHPSEHLLVGREEVLPEGPWIDRQPILHPKVVAEVEDVQWAELEPPVDQHDVPVEDHGDKVVEPRILPCEVHHEVPERSG